MKNLLTRLLVCLLSVTLIALPLASCGDGTSEQGGTGSPVTGDVATGEPVIPTKPLDVSEMFSEKDLLESFPTDAATLITLSDGATAASPAGGVSIDRDRITITAEGTYLLRGSLSNGSVTVDADKSAKVRLLLDGVDLCCRTSAAIYIKSADKVFINLVAGSENKLSNAEDFVAIDENNIDSVIFSKEDLTINGAGKLTIDAAFGHGVVSKDDLVIGGGVFKIDAAAHAFTGKDSIRIAGGDFDIVSEKDAFHAENTDDAALGFIYVAGGSFKIIAGYDSFDAQSTLQIDGGDFEIKTGGGSANASTGGGGERNPAWGNWGGSGTSSVSSASAKALKAGSDVTVKGGIFRIDCSDDAIHSNSSVCIMDGAFTISSGDDGIHADSQTAINGGHIMISKSYEGIEGKSIEIAGGEIELVASDDGLNAAGGNDGSGLGGRPGMGAFDTDGSAYIKISGGRCIIDASGDGIDSNGALYVSGGEVYVSGPTNSGNGVLDYGLEAVVSGGVVVASGSSGMAQGFSSSSTQGAMLCTVGSWLTGEISLKNASGDILVSYTPPKQYNCIIISHPEIKKGETYELVAGGASTEITMTSLVMGGGSGGGMQPGGAPGGMPGGMPGDVPGGNRPTKPGKK